MLKIPDRNNLEEKGFVLVHGFPVARKKLEAFEVMGVGGRGLST